mgnify:CR=1 FL=1
MKDDIITLNRGAKELAQGITLENVPLNQYMEFLAVAQDWKKVVAEIAECCEVDLSKIFEARNKADEYCQKVTAEKGDQIVDTEQEKEYRALLQNYESAKKYPEMIIDGNKVIALCMKYAHLGVPKSVCKQYGWKEGLPDTTKVRIE